MTDRDPKIGDVIRTATPMRFDSLSHRAGDYLSVELLTREAAAEAVELVASGRWVIVEQQPAGEHGPNNEGSNE